MNQLCFGGRHVLAPRGRQDWPALTRFFIYGDDACYGYVASQHFPPPWSPTWCSACRAVSNWDIAGKRQLNSTSDTNRYYIMRNRGYLARYMRIYGDYHPVLFRLGNAATFCKDSFSWLPLTSALRPAFRRCAAA